MNERDYATLIVEKSLKLSEIVTVARRVLGDPRAIEQSSKTIGFLKAKAEDFIELAIELGSAAKTVSGDSSLFHLRDSSVRALNYVSRSSLEMGRVLDEVAQEKPGCIERVIDIMENFTIFDKSEFFNIFSDGSGDSAFSEVFYDSLDAEGVSY